MPATTPKHSKKTHIGNHPLHPETQMMNYGFDPSLSEGSVEPPVFLTSTFVFRTAEEGRDFFDVVSGRQELPPGESAGLVYSRFNHPNSEIVEDRLAVFEGAESCALLAVDSKLRGCDLVRLKTGQLVVNATVRQRATTIQQKTEKPVQFELTEQTRDSLLAWLRYLGGSPDDYVFPSRTRTGKHLSTRQCTRLVGEWVEAVGLGRSAYGTHSLRRTKVALIYKRTGNSRAVQILLGHTKLECTVRYLGVDAEDALSLSEATEI